VLKFRGVGAEEPKEANGARGKNSQKKGPLFTPLHPNFIPAESPKGGGGWVCRDHAFLCAPAKKENALILGNGGILTGREHLGTFSKMGGNFREEFWGGGGGGGGGGVEGPPKKVKKKAPQRGRPHREEKRHDTKPYIIEDVTRPGNRSTKGINTRLKICYLLHKNMVRRTYLEEGGGA